MKVQDVTNFHHNMRVLLENIESISVAALTGGEACQKRVHELMQQQQKLIEDFKNLEL